MIRPTVARVDLAALESQLPPISSSHLAAERRRRPAPRAPGIIAVVKANAYGHGAAQVALALEDAGADLLACADIEEGAALRAAGVRADILVFGALSVSDLDGLFDCRLTPTISTPGAARAVQAAAEKYKQRVRYHLKIDTGMNRLGFRFDNLRADAAGLFASANLDLDAVYTHFATADDPESPLFGEQRAAVRAGACRDRRRMAKAAMRRRQLCATRRALRSTSSVRPRRQQRRVAARLARLVRPRPAGSAALRHRPAAAGVDASTLRPALSLGQPYRRGEGRARTAKASATACRSSPSGRDDRDRPGGLRRRPRPAPGRSRRRA